MDRWRLNETDFIAHAVGNQREMVVPGGDHTGSGSEFLTILRLMDREGAEFVEMLSHDPGKIGRDMLDDDDRWKSGRQAREKVAQGLDSSGGGADDDDLARREFSGWKGLMGLDRWGSRGFGIFLSTGCECLPS
jgi:hypothetical protein